MSVVEVDAVGDVRKRRVARRVHSDETADDLLVARQGGRQSGAEATDDETADRDPVGAEVEAVIQPGRAGEHDLPAGVGSDGGRDANRARAQKRVRSTRSSFPWPLSLSLRDAGPWCPSATAGRTS